MRFYHFLLFVFLFSCKIKDKATAIAKGSSVEEPTDTFNVRDLYKNASFQKDISLDTLEIKANKKHTGISIVFPKLSREDYPEVYQQIDNLVETKKREFYEMIKDDIVKYDSSIDTYCGWGMWIQPKNLYQTSKLISFGIENGWGYTGLPAGFEYNVINYDIQKKKQISLGDYFMLHTRSDTSYLEKIIGRSINRELGMNKYLSIGGRINFSFDDLYVYFFFDKYDILGWGISSVKKEYIIEHINPLYL